MEGNGGTNGTGPNDRRGQRAITYADIVGWIKWLPLILIGTGLIINWTENKISIQDHGGRLGMIEKQLSPDNIAGWRSGTTLREYRLGVIEKKLNALEKTFGNFNSCNK